MSQTCGKSAMRRPIHLGCDVSQKRWDEIFGAVPWKANKIYTQKEIEKLDNPDEQAASHLSRTKLRIVAAQPDSQRLRSRRG